MANVPEENQKPGMLLVAGCMVQLIMQCNSMCSMQGSGVELGVGVTYDDVDVLVKYETRENMVVHSTKI